jgi:hypothetical protein
MSTLWLYDAIHRAAAASDDLVTWMLKSPILLHTARCNICWQYWGSTPLDANPAERSCACGQAPNRLASDGGGAFIPKFPCSNGSFPLRRGTPLRLGTGCVCIVSICGDPQPRRDRSRSGRYAFGSLPIIERRFSDNEVSRAYGGRTCAIGDTRSSNPSVRDRH